MELKIISFNIRCKDDQNGHSIAERAPRLYEVTKDFDADVIGFQEYRPKWEEHIAHYFSDYEIFNKYRSETTKDVESAPILWKRDRFECLDRGYFWLSDTPEVESRGWDERFNCFRMCEWVILRCKKTGKTFTFMNTHFGFGDKGQIASAELIHQYSKRISNHPTILVGDFNMSPSAPAYAAITAHFTDANAACENDLSNTFHGYDPEAHEEFTYHIDYCFVNEQVKPLSQTICKTTVDNKFPSDHYGLLIKLKI